MKGGWGKIVGFLEIDGHACLVTLVTVRGSSPREAGARMVIGVDGRFSGSIGGGALEWQVLAEAQRLMSTSPAGAGRVIDIALGPDIGQCCGGSVSVLIEAFGIEDRNWIATLAKAESSGMFFSKGERDHRGIFPRSITVNADEATFAPLLTGGVLLERFDENATPLLLFGAGHVGRALVLALAPLPFAIRWIDSRFEAFPAVFPANAIPVASGDPVAEIAPATPGTLLLAMTHSHALDLAIIAAALKNPNIADLGVIGSMTKRRRFASRLRDAGFDEADISRMVCPIGSPHLRAKEPVVIAATLAVQLLEWREAMMMHKAEPRASIRKGSASMIGRSGHG